MKISNSLHRTWRPKTLSGLCIPPFCYMSLLSSVQATKKEVVWKNKINTHSKNLTLRNIKLFDFHKFHCTKNISLCCTLLVYNKISKFTKPSLNALAGYLAKNHPNVQSSFLFWNIFCVKHDATYCHLEMLHDSKKYIF